LAGIRVTSNDAFSYIKPEGFLEFNSTLRQGFKAFAEVSASAEQIAGVAGIKVTW
jgi:hypothetical protein